jgi:cytosine deaminase
MALPELVIANARLAGRDATVDVAVVGGVVVGIEPSIAAEAPRHDAGGRLLTSGLVECHIHLDKAMILDRTRIAEGTLAEAVRETAKAKAAFTVEDVYERAARVVRLAVSHGTTAMRTFVEVDPRAGLRSFEALKAIRADFAHSIDIEICAFAQEGLTNEPETEALLVAALQDGADLVGGCTYTDPDPTEHVRRIFALAERFGTAVDFHTDFDLDPTGAHLPLIVAETRRLGYEGRVVCGHVTKLAAVAPEALELAGRQVAEAGIGVVALPATDLFLLGRGAGALAPRGIAPLMQLHGLGARTAVATNNVLNPFTPFGDANLIRMANLFANAAQLASDGELETAFTMIGAQPAAMLGRRHGVELGGAADLVLLEAASGAEAVRTIAPVRTVWKAGRVVAPSTSFAGPPPPQTGEDQER